MKKSTKKKIRDIRSSLVMVLVMVAMLSTASYAWFTMSSSPTVTGMQMTAAASGGGLKVALDASDEFKNAIDVETANEILELKPVTPIDVTTAGSDNGNGKEVNIFNGPIYAGGRVTGLAPIDNEDAIKGYVAKYTYYIKETTENASAGESVDVGIIIGNATQSTPFGSNTGLGNDGNPLLDGSFVRRAITKPNTDSASINPSHAVRVGFVVKTEDGSTVLSRGMYVWEPNEDGKNDGVTLTKGQDYAESEVTVEETLHLKSAIAGTVTSGGSGNISNAIFSMSKGSKAKVEMYVWLQGTDEQCANPIQTGSLQAQVQFTIVGAEGTTNGTPATP